jgi:ATP-dependent helicase HrpB
MTMTMTDFPPLPIDPILPDLLAALDSRGVAVLQAPPGAGKTTRVPLALLDAAWLAGRKVMVLEPRRLAARAAARRMAAMLGEAVGQTVGYRVRLDTRVGPATRIEVVTDGLFLRQLQDDPGLETVGAVLFDEFHERGLDSDLALALCLEARGALREDLRLVVMSATLDGAPVAALLGDAPLVTSQGRAFPVETRHLDAPPSGPASGPGSGTGRLVEAVAGAVRRALADETGNILVFLPGAGEIRRVQRTLEGAGLGPGVEIAPLYGDLPADVQDRAIAPTPPGRRKVVLATSIAETSLTIEGIRVVVDGGHMRVPRFDPRSGMTRLATVKVSQASAEQRRGRAGRLEPGVCYRLWPEASHKALAPFTAPEIREADLAPLALELAMWGAGDTGTLAWLDPPPPPALSQARELLRELGALDEANAITAHGRRMAGFGVHPRLSHMMLKGAGLGHGALACLLAALLSERDIVKAAPGARDSDLRLRVDLLTAAPAAAGSRLSVDRGAREQVLKQARTWQRQLGIRDGRNQAGRPGAAATGLLVALAYPDRIARRRPGAPPPGQGAQYRLSNGRGAYFAEPEPLSAEDLLAVADLDGVAREARIFLAAPLTLAELEDTFADDIRDESFVTWDAREEAVQARRQRRLFALVLKDERLADPPAGAVPAAMAAGIRAMGLGCLPWSEAARAWQARVSFMRRIEGADTWPDVSDEALTAGLDDWLVPHLGGRSRRGHLAGLDLAAALKTMLPWALSRRLDDEAPTHVEVPSGSRVPIDYSGDTPVLAVRLQEMFGLAESPRIAGGRVALLLHLLSPARRPVQVTSDLASFWANAYRAVRSDLKGQYPKHYWPDDPLQAEPTARAKPRGR